MGERRHGSNLDDFAKLATWPTPTASLATKGVCSEQGAIVEAMRSHGPDLAAVAALSSWPTPTVNDSKGDYTYGSGDHERICLKLSGTAKLAGWGTPTASEAHGTPEQALQRKQQAVANGTHIGLSTTALSHQAQLASWATPAARDWKSNSATEEHHEMRAQETRGKPLSEQAHRLVQPEDSGETPSGSTAATGSGGQLDPNLSRWLMGLPPEWDQCAPREERSGRSRRAKSRASGASKATATPSSPL
jgi:hypothetical protein